MYNRSQLAFKYLRYFFSASNGRGHGIHSPFVFDFIKNVLRDKKKHDCYHKIESRRNYLMHDNGVIDVEDLGAGSMHLQTSKRRIKDIAASSLRSKKYARLLFRIVQYLHPKNILELGTSFGISTAYMAAGNPDANIITIEGAASVASLARQGFDELGLQQIELLQGEFSSKLPQALAQLKTIDLVFIDGNHRRVPTLAYFDQLLACSTPSTVLIFDDIYWSLEMENAWSEIKHHPRVKLTLDLFFFGIVFFNEDIKIPQHFMIRF